MTGRVMTRAERELAGLLTVKTHDRTSDRRRKIVAPAFAKPSEVYPAPSSRSGKGSTKGKQGKDDTPPPTALPSQRAAVSPEPPPWRRDASSSSLRIPTTPPRRDGKGFGKRPREEDGEESDD